MKILYYMMILIPSIAFSKTIELTPDNTIALRDTVNWSSISKLQLDLINKSKKLNDNDIIYLVLDTPGGSVSAGEMFIQTMRGIKQPIHAIVIYAASMGFQIVQASSRRLILNNGTIMSHRATIALSGQMNGEIESRLFFYKKVVGLMQERAAKRIGLTVSVYNERIINEWWERGKTALEVNLVDEIINVTCDKKLIDKKEKVVISTLFGRRTLTFSKCPLITAPLLLSGESEDDDYMDNTTPLSIYLNLLFFNKKTFINNYINSGMFNK